MSEKFGYGMGAIQSGDHFFIAGVEWSLEDNDVDHGIVFECTNGAWTAWSVDFRVVDINIHENSGLFFAIGRTGEVEVTSPSKAWDERVGDPNNGPSGIRPIIGASVIDDFVYVVGMRRQVYRRSITSETWDRYDFGCLVDSKSKEIRGFNAIHGLVSDELFAVGLAGEIWHCVAGRWSALDSPTNSRLDAVHHLKDRTVLAGGALGTLLKGDASGFSVIAQGATEQAITGFAELAGRVFVATDNGPLFELVNDALVEVTVPLASHEGGGHVSAAGGKLLYVRNDLVATFDGKAWNDVTPPDNA